MVNIELRPDYSNLKCFFFLKAIGVRLKGVIIRLWAGEFVCGQLKIFCYKLARLASREKI